jgi:hypothetical protein
MVYSIVRHLWKLSKSKKFLPLPPLPPSQQEHSTDISEFCIDSIPDAEGEISASSIYHLPLLLNQFHHIITTTSDLVIFITQLLIPKF